MTFDEAYQLLKPLRRVENPDNAYGDTEIVWLDDKGNEVAYGYLAPGVVEIHVGGMGKHVFKDDEAAALKKLGKRRAVKHGTEDA